MGGGQSAVVHFYRQELSRMMPPSAALVHEVHCRYLAVFLEQSSAGKWYLGHVKVA